VVLDGLENLEVMLSIIETFGDDLPPACRNTCQEAWLFFDPFIAKYGADYNTCERVTRVLRFSLTFFGSTALPVIPSVLARMATSFEATGFASYLWIIGKTVSQFGNEEGETLRSAIKQAFERTSTKLLKMLQETPPSQIPDGKDSPL
jgi:transportin-3